MLKSEFTGECMIFAKEYNDKTFYSVGLSKKKADGTYENGYMDVSFKKGVNLPNQSKITITKGWLTFYKNKDKHTVPQIFIAEFESDVQAPSGFDEPQMPEGFSKLDDDDISF